MFPRLPAAVQLERMMQNRDQVETAREGKIGDLVRLLPKSEQLTG